MTIVITILAIIGGLIALFLLIAFFTPREFSVVKEISINKPKQDVFRYVKMLKNQEQYSVWVMKDPKIRLVYTGTDGTTGATSSWESDDKNVGVGEQEIKKIIEGESMEVEIRFQKPFKAVNHAITTLKATGDRQTSVSTLFYGKSKFPMNFSNLFIGKLVGKDMQNNLENLKALLEK